MKKEVLFKKVSPTVSYLVLLFFFVSSVLLYLSQKSVEAVSNINSKDSAGWQEHLE